MINTLPFESSLKNKGTVRKLIKVADLAVSDIEGQMLGLADDFQNTFRSNPSLRLVLQAQPPGRGGGRGTKRLLWRLYKSSWGAQKYVTLFTTDEGLCILRQIPPAVRSVVLRFEPRRLELNARVIMAMMQSRTCTNYLQAWGAMEAFQSGAKKTA